MSTHIDDPIEFATALLEAGIGPVEARTLINMKYGDDVQIYLGDDAEGGREVKQTPTVIASVTYADLYLQQKQSTTVASKVG